MKRQYLWMLAAILTICGIMTLTSCSSNDDDNEVPTYYPLLHQLKGNWYNAYETSGRINAFLYNDRLTEALTNYTHVLDNYNFDTSNNSQKGTLTRYFYGGDETQPLAFDIVSFTFLPREEKPIVEDEALGSAYLTLVFDGAKENGWGKSFPQASTLYYEDGELMVNGVGGHKINMVHADKTMVAFLDVLWGKSDGTGSDATPYKPVGVDHSQWMAPLADDRLVCDLSLPGTHDACTAEGWHLASLAAETTAKAQDLTINEQLKVGVRVFDMRPERVLNAATDQYELRCSHGMMQTNLLVEDFFRKLKTFLAANPTEFCIVTCNLTNTNDLVGYRAWKKQFAEIINRSEFSGLFTDFKPCLTVGDMRGKVLLLSRYEYDGNIVGGLCKDWSNDEHFDKQVNGKIVAADGSEAPLWTQDYYTMGFNLKGKDEAIRKMLDATAARDLTAAAPAWVFNYSAGYMYHLANSDNYRENATRTNRLVIDYLKNPLHNASTGIIYMDYAGMQRSPAFHSSAIYETSGLELVEALINQNFRSPGTVDASLFTR